MSNQLSLNMQQQKQDNWCWAAVATSIAQFLDNPTQWTQCALASTQLNQGNDGCCTDGDNPDTCDTIAHLETSLSLVGHRSPAQPNPSPGITGTDVIKQEIDDGRPLGVRIGWDDSLDQGHFVLITGYDDSTANFVVMINDPEKPDGS